MVVSESRIHWPPRKKLQQINISQSDMEILSWKKRGDDMFMIVKVNKSEFA